MAESNEKKIQYFVALCDDLITCKFLVAESKIGKLLACLAETEPIYQLVSDCMEQFNRDREMNKAFVTDGKGRFFCIMPTEEYKIIALVFCTLADIEQKKIDFTDFIKRFFDNEEGINCYTSFARHMILPFRELIAEAFGLPKRYSKPEPAAETTADERPQPQAQQPEEEKSEKETDSCVKLARDMLLEIEHNEKDKQEVRELKLILRAFIEAAQNDDRQTYLALAIGARHAAKGIKSVKFLMKEFDDEMDDLLDDYFDED